MAYSDATGGDADPNRYICPSIANGQESTHVFEFQIAESPSEIDQIEVLWEGYADQCTQAELYVWDYVNAQWGDGNGLLGQNRFMDNAAANRDHDLVGVIQKDFTNFIAPSGQMTFLLYAERTRDETFHDYMQVQVYRRMESVGIAYCTAGTSASGCQAGLSTAGVASASAPSGFDLIASTVEGEKDGLFFFGTQGRQANPRGTGSSLVPDLLEAPEEPRRRRGRAGPALVSRPLQHGQPDDQPVGRDRVLRHALRRTVTGPAPHGAPPIPPPARRHPRRGRSPPGCPRAPPSGGARRRA
jgi:hypothetical protein